MNFTQNTGKIKNIYTGKLYKILVKSIKICQPVSVKTMQIWYHTLNKKRNFKIYWETGKNTGKLREICQSEKSGNHVQYHSNGFYHNGKLDNYFVAFRVVFLSLYLFFISKIEVREVT